jgi:hypothetical protein
MKRLRSNAVLLVVLCSLIGQAGASGLLMCADMDSMMDANMADHSAMHGAANQATPMDLHGHNSDAVQNDAVDHDCELCVSCGSVLDLESHSARAVLSITHGALNYTNPLPTFSLDNPFRPPIIA